jgi:chemotaxis protein MotB
MERWLLTYADMITLLLIFFVVMYALSNVDAQKFAAIAEALSRALGGGGGMVLNYPGPSVVQGSAGQQQDRLKELQDLQRAVQAGEAARMEQVAARLQERLEQEGLAGRVTVSVEERGVVITFLDTVLFPIGSDELTPRAREILRRVGQELRELPNYVRVEGHTCDLPINNRRFPSNWELSVARATSVVQALIRDAGIPPARLSASGYGEYRPRVPNDSEAHRQLNRRVDLVILRTKYEATEPVAGRPQS